MFHGANDFNQDLSSWDVSSVSVMSHMFFDANNFNQDLSAWELSSVKNMFVMFQYADRFNQDLCAWRTRLPETTLVVSMFGQGNSAGPAESCPSTLDPDLPNGPMCHVCDDGRGG